MPWIVVSAAVALIVSLFFIQPRLVVIYNDELSVYVRVLFIKFRLYPQKQKKIRLSDYKIKKWRKTQEKERLRAEKEAEKKRRKEAAAGKTGAVKKGVSPGETLDFIKDLITPTVKKLFSSIRADVYDLRISVGTPEAATTALTYAAAVSSAACLMELLSSLPHFRIMKNAVISVEPDFVSERTEASLHIVLRARVWQLIAVAISGLRAYVVKS